MVESAESGLHSARLRAAALAVGFVLVAGFGVVLLVSSRILSAQGPPSVRVYIVAQATPPRPAAARPPPAGAALQSSAPPTATQIPTSQLLACFDHDADARHRAHCPEEPRPAWNPNAPRPGEPPHESRLPARDFGELVLRTPGRCELDSPGVTVVKVCQSLYPDPPPPSRTPEEICEAGRIGPCHPPPFSGPTYTRRR